MNFKSVALGHRLIKPHPEPNCSKLHGGEEVGVVLVESGGDGAKMLDPVEEPLDAIAMLVDACTECGRIGAMVERSDVGKCAGVRNLRPQRVAVVAAIRQQYAVGSEQPKHPLARPSVVSLAFGQLEEDREAVHVDDRVDLGRKPTAGASHATTTAAFFSPLAAC